MKSDSEKTQSISFFAVIPGTPVPMARARSGRGGRHYTPQKQREWMANVRWALNREAAARGYPIGHERPVELELTFVFERAKSNKTTAHTQRPDASNLAKLIEDAANGVLFHDDSQVIRLIANKKWGLPARTEVALRSIEC